MKNNTRTLEDLRAKLEGHIYVSFHSREEYDAFLAKAETEGSRFGEHLPTEYLGKPWDIVSLLEGKKLAFCGTASHIAYRSGAKNVHRVDYAKYVSGADDYMF